MQELPPNRRAKGYGCSKQPIGFGCTEATVTNSIPHAFSWTILAKGPFFLRLVLVGTFADLWSSSPLAACCKFAVLFALARIANNKDTIWLKISTII